MTDIDQYEAAGLRDRIAELESQLEARGRDIQSAAERAYRLEIDFNEQRRLTESYNRELQTFKTRVRDRMIQEAEARGWCNEFDDILVEFGLEPRSGNYEVRFEVSGTIEVTVLARGEEHASELAHRSIARNFYDGAEFEGAGATLILYDVQENGVERRA